MVKVHVILAIVFTVLLIPSLLFWVDSVLWVIFLSIYAIVEVHVIGAITALTNKRMKEQ